MQNNQPTETNPTNEGTTPNLNPAFNYSIFSITPDELVNHQRDMLNEMEYFSIRTANEALQQAKNMPEPRMLFSELWYENELCILFADTNTGKSILAVQIADSISRGKPIPGFKLGAESQKVLYFDFELSDKQFEGRYTADYIYAYRFDPNLLRAGINPNFNLYDEKTVEDYLVACFEKAVVTTGARVLIIDNITYLKNETEKAKDALPLMKMLKHLKNKYGLSILVLAHTPKRDMTKQLTRNDLSGSKMLINFCDSAFAIGESTRETGLRYIKQIKERATERLYDYRNVILCRINKPYNFLQFEMVGIGNEYEHLKQMDKEEKSELEQNVEALLNEDNTLTAYAIARRLCTDDNKFNSLRTQVQRIIKRLQQ